jgi:MFS family permease
MTDAVAPAVATAPVESTAAPLAYRRYALGLLLVVYMLNFLDRAIVNILNEPIKHDLHVADWLIGLMGGSAFGILYTLLALPIARLAQTWNRAAIVAGSLAIWSGFTMLCGAAQNFVQLCLARIGVGFGEAGCTPQAHSIIADDTPPKDRAFALSFYAMGTPLGGLLGLVVGAVVNHFWGWRMAFAAAGAPGLLFALLVATTLREPRKRLAARAAEVAANQPTLRETFATLRRKPTFWLMALAAAIFAFIGYGQAQFTSSFFMRTHTAELARLAQSGFGGDGLLFYAVVGGVLGGVAGALGSVFGGKVTDMMTARDIRAYATVPLVSSLLWAPTYIASTLAPTAVMSLLIGIVPGVLGTFWYGPIYSVAQSVVPPRLRPTAAALMLFIINFIGLIFGPLFAGFVSDVLKTFPSIGDNSAQWSLVVMTAFVIPGILLCAAARRTLSRDIES